MTKKITTFFTDSGSPKTGLSATIRIRNLATGSLVITDAAMTEVGDGFYSYDFTTYDEELDYSIRCDGSASVTSASERYTYAGNESYMEDILDASIDDHSVVGSVGASIMGAMGAVVIPDGPNRTSGSAFTKEQLELIAKEVWTFILKNDLSAQDVLISRSDFNAIRDKVLIGDINIPEILTIKSLITEISSNIDEIQNKKISVEVPQDLVTMMDTVLKNVNSLCDDVCKIVPTIEESARVINESVDEFSDKIVDFESQMAGTNLDLSKAAELAGALTAVKDSLMTMISLAGATNSAESQRAREMMKRNMITLTNIKFMSLTKK